MENNLRSELKNLLGKENMEKIFSSALDKLIDISELTPENLDYAQDFFQNTDFDTISNYIGDDFTFLDVVKKFYDVQLPLDTVIGGAQRKIILDRKFSFDVKKKIVNILNSFDEPEESEKFFRLLDIISDEEEFLMAELSLKEIIFSDKLYQKVMSDKKNLHDAVNIVKYNMHSFKKELSFENLAWLVNILMALPMQSQNFVRIWINNIKSDKECEKLDDILISVINCKKLTDDVSYKKYSVSEAIKIYNDIKSKVHNENLSVKNLNNAFSIIMTLDEDKNFDEKKLATATDLISLIHDDIEFSQIKIFIKILASFEELPQIIRENNFSLIEVLPVMLKIYFMGANRLLKRNFNFDSIRKIIKLFEKCNKNDEKIEIILDLIDKINSDSELNYCREFLFELSQNKKMLKDIKNGKVHLLKQIKKLYIKYFRISSVSTYIIKIIETEKFSFETIEQADRLIAKKSPTLRQVATDLILKLNDDYEFIFAKHFFSEVEFLDEYTQTENLLEDIKLYYKITLEITDNQKNKIAIIENEHLSFESISDAVNLLSLENNNERADKISKLISMINNENEYKILRPFFYKLIESDKIFFDKRKILSAFYDMLYETADKFKIRKIFNNKFLSLNYKSQAMDYLKKIENEDQRDSLADLICILKNDKEYDKVYPYLNNLVNVENLSAVIKGETISAKQIIQICKLGIDKIWVKNIIDFDHIKKLSVYFAQSDKEKIDVINALFELIEKQEQFDLIFPYVDYLFDNNKIIHAVAKKEISLDAICNLCKIGAEKIFMNKNFTFSAINTAEKILTSIEDKTRQEHIINIISNLSSGTDLIYIKEFLLSGKIEKTDKSYHEAAQDFYIEKLSNKYAKKYIDVASKIKHLAVNYRFSYTILEQIAKMLNNCSDEKKRTALFNKLMMFKNDNDFLENMSSIDNYAIKEQPEKKSNFDARMKKATKSAETINNEINQNSGYGGGNIDSSLIFDDDNLVLNIIDSNAILQFKDKKLVIMTNEIIATIDKTMRGKFTAMSIKINAEIDENLKSVDSPIDYFNEFKNYLNEHGDSASIEDDQDEGETYCCLITSKGLEELISDHENFLKWRVAED